jgi:hypothetical protein
MRTGYNEGLHAPNHVHEHAPEFLSLLGADFGVFMCVRALACVRACVRAYACMIRWQLVGQVEY